MGSILDPNYSKVVNVLITIWGYRHMALVWHMHPFGTNLSLPFSIRPLECTCSSKGFWVPSLELSDKEASPNQSSWRWYKIRYKINHFLFFKYLPVRWVKMTPILICIFVIIKVYHPIYPFTMNYLIIFFYTFLFFFYIFLYLLMGSATKTAHTMCGSYFPVLNFLKKYLLCIN